jgi:hypothetical protein
VPAYDQVKVWEVDPNPGVRPRPARPPHASRSGGPVAEGRAHRVDTRKRWEIDEKVFVWARLGCVATLGTAILWWPYGRSCGIGLATYLAATTMIIVGGLWVVACTWISRMARTHALAMLVALWGAVLVTVEVLPRSGYARVEAAWLCR